MIDAVMRQTEIAPVSDLRHLLQTDSEAREKAKEWVAKQ